MNKNNQDDKKRKIFLAIGDIDDDLVEEGRPRQYARKHNNPAKWIAAAAAALLLIFVTPLLLKTSGLLQQGGPKGSAPSLSGKPGTIEVDDYALPLKAVVYPEAGAFEDYEDWEDSVQKALSQESFDAVNNFSYKTASSILSDNQAQNISYSPLSLYFALGIATSGAGSQTNDELLDLLGSKDKAGLSELAEKLYRQLYLDNEIATLRIANSLWLDDDMNGVPVEFKDAFANNAADNFYASSHSVDFSNPMTGQAMAEWISGQTNGSLEPEIETDPDQVLSILNTIYFYDQWLDNFKEADTAPDIFYLPNGKVVTVDFMNSRYLSKDFYRGDGYTRAALSLKNGGSMLFVLPDEDVKVSSLIESPELIASTLAGGTEFSGEVIWQIPKFDFSSRLDLGEMLQKLGVKDAFTASADFSDITDKQIYISGVQQEARISVNEEGVEASAFTNIVFAGNTMPDNNDNRAEMILNRPFIFAVTMPVLHGDADDFTADDCILFVGICENPSENPTA